MTDASGEGTPRKAQEPLPARRRLVCLTIAGFDPTSGAGITADLKTFAAHGVYGVACITALTVQSTQGVRAVEAVAPSLIRRMLECLTSDLTLAGVKVGMLGTAEAVWEIDDFLRARPELRERTVLDPVLQSSSGAALLDPDGIALLRDRLLGVVGWITPNLGELATLTDMEVSTREQVPVAAMRLAELAEAAGNPGIQIVVTGGHLQSPDDYLLVDGKAHWIAGERVETTSTHGTGCAYSSALTAALVSGRGSGDAATAAKQYVTKALRSAHPVGHGRGPMHHLFALDPITPETRSLALTKD